jgi:hypothetical protein
MKSRLLSSVMAIVLTVVAGSVATGIAAEQVSRGWSIVVHLEYEDGSAYDYPFATGVSTREMASYLAECGRSHRTGSVVRYHCYPIPE